ncbi:MAG: amidohydrolase family protein [Planctomycetes bacterium]|nr:amidohydrolase family protein [Planctomycetota bacterium]
MSDDTSGRGCSRRGALKSLGGMGTAAALGGLAAGEGAAAERPAAEEPRPASAQEEIAERVRATPLVDTHEHLPDEEVRLRGEGVCCDDWAVLFSHYLDSDLVVAGMPPGARDQLLSAGPDPLEKWRLLAPYWPAVRNTGYGRAVQVALRELYGIEELSEAVIPALQQAYEALRKPGMYQKVLVEAAGIESCQVNCLWRPYRESRQPTLLMQDISFLGLHLGPEIDVFAGPAGKEVRDLADWHGVIDWWFDTYARYAVAVKSQGAYRRGLDHDDVPAERAEPAFRKVLAQEPLLAAEQKDLEDHLFWYCVRRATEHGLPVKLHLGYYAGENYMPLGRVERNVAQASDLCRLSPDTRFVFMHIAYPCWQELLAVAKHYANAYVDMCWAWIIDPVSSKEFLKRFLVTAPSNKILPFGGDYIPVEPVLGHARLARQGIARALVELVEEGWLSPRDALELVEPILRGNARALFRLEEKERNLSAAPWR